MTTSTTTAESDAYLAAVRVELDDLPEEERLFGRLAGRQGRRHLARRPEPEAGNRATLSVESSDGQDLLGRLRVQGHCEEPSIGGG